MEYRETQKIPQYYDLRPNFEISEDWIKIYFDKNPFFHVACYAKVRNYENCHFVEKGHIMETFKSLENFYKYYSTTQKNFCSITHLDDNNFKTFGLFHAEDVFAAIRKNESIYAICYGEDFSFPLEKLLFDKLEEMNILVKKHGI